MTTRLKVLKQGEKTILLVMECEKKLYSRKIAARYEYNLYCTNTPKFFGQSITLKDIQPKDFVKDTEWIKNIN